MHEKLIERLRWMEDVCKKDISCPVPCINECFFKEVADAIEELLWCINYMATCDNCKYFGGCCCDHVDADGKCLGWELCRKPTEEEKKRYDKYMAEAVRITKQVLEERGALDEDGNIKPQWKDVFMRKSDMSGSMYDGVDMYGREWKEEDADMGNYFAKLAKVQTNISGTETAKQTNKEEVKHET